MFDSFTAHNIRLPNGTTTMEAGKPLLADEPSLKATMRMLNLIYGGNLAQRSILDLGCLEGGYALEFAKAGMNSKGLDVRQSNIDNCELIADAFKLPNLSFVKDDCWNIAKYGPVDIMFCCGLLYHLDRPREFIKLMADNAKDAIIINTHYAPVDGAPEIRIKLSPLALNEGAPGRWYGEHNLETVEEKEKLKWFAWDNKTSFWLLKSALLQILHDCGFSTVLEQYDFLGENIFGSMNNGYYATDARAMFVAIR